MPHRRNKKDKKAKDDAFAKPDEFQPEPLIIWNTFTYVWLFTVVWVYLVILFDPIQGFVPESMLLKYLTVKSILSLIFAVIFFYGLVLFLIRYFILDEENERRRREFEMTKKENPNHKQPPQQN